MNPLENTDVDKNITITGRLTDIDGNVLRYTGVGVLLTCTSYGDNYTTQYLKEYTRTDKDGYYTYIYTPKTGGSLDVCVYYPGYHYYRYNKTTSHIWVMPKSTIVTIDPIDLSHHEKVTVTGKLTDADGRTLRNTSVGVLIDGKNKTYYKTNSKGIYSFEYEPTVA